MKKEQSNGKKEIIWYILNFNKNINMAYKVASKYYKTGYWDYEEALQIAQMGLWKLYFMLLK